MHYHLEVHLSSLDDWEKAIEDIMAPYREGGGAGDFEFWDWWQIGGRYTGRHDGYNPYEDRRNYEVCKFCGGAGSECIRCRGFHDVDGSVTPYPFGPGLRPVWSTEFVPHDGDIIALSAADGYVIEAE